MQLVKQSLISLLTESPNRFSVYYDLSQRASIDSVEQADSIEDMLKSHGVHSILDTACGTGLPSLELRRRGYNIDCYDGELSMLEVFRQRAQMLGVDDTCSVVLWQDLQASIAKQYDCVLCLGNSLIYNNLWMGRSPEINLTESYDSVFLNFRHVLKVGGYLYIDAPRSVNTMPLHEVSTHIDLRTFNQAVASDNTVGIKVREVVYELRNSRFWDCHISAEMGNATPRQSYNFVRYSHKMTIMDFKRILSKFGFGNFFEVPAKSGRPSHAALVAQRVN